jgi:hypothetical protein
MSNLEKLEHELPILIDILQDMADILKGDWDE